MAKDQENDVDEDIIPDDPLTATLRDALDKAEADSTDDDQDESGGFDAPIEDADIEKREVMTEEEGTDAIQKARDGTKFKTDEATAPKSEEKNVGGKPDGKAVEAEEADKGDEADSEAGDKPDDKAADVDLTDESYAAEIAKMPNNVQERIKSYQAIAEPFKGREAEFEGFGKTPAEVVRSLVQINDYAQRDPSDYAAWAIQQTTGNDPEKIQKVITEAAEKLGFRVTKEDGPDLDDPFLTDKERELMEENAALRASAGAENGPVVGPNAPENQMRQIALDFINEVGADGQPVRPDYETLHPLITQIVAQQKAAGVQITKDVLQEAYTQAEFMNPDTREAAALRLAAQKNSAQPKTDVLKQDQQNAAKVRRAKDASSKIIDGPGQGTSRQPAKDSDLSIDALLKKAWDS